MVLRGDLEEKRGKMNERVPNGCKAGFGGTADDSSRVPTSKENTTDDPGVDALKSS